MFIHTVQHGDSLYSISNSFNIPVEQLRSVNGLEVTTIVPGQAILIPLYQYTVLPGDTLSSIARKAFVPLDQLRAANPNVNPYLLQPGMQITIPDISKYVASTLSFYVVRSPELDKALINDFAPYSTYISIFEYRFGMNGDIINELNDIPAIEVSWESGVNIDFEQIRGADRDLYIGFLRLLKERLQSEGHVLTVAVPAKTGEDISWLAGYDYGGIGSVVDYMFIMAYDWHYPGSEPGPVAPINNVRSTIEFAINKVPRKKIILGVPLYGYDWSLPYESGSEVSAISNQDAIDTAMLYLSPIQYSEEVATPFFRYQDDQGQVHEVWFEDVRSMSRKMQLVQEYGLQGIGAWQLTLGFTAGPWVLTKFFTVRKV
ncbi:glycosyl hydrolase family 18 protein [Tenuibacillus multivorans]|uniref:Spore germination protein YaaH n=1 Tax=Tenuibacillus multivorans TaxID=237069 RepID=A0A1G9YK44_9BACI|nr:LysM peptidoglycan-binding domain-containing protein [Tenuibacillus multivorans]GEL78443.1 putative sporulation-specific glycosylase YdhD [Tenuibacillus multivorans]SDN09410.1 Spore germination protein YaaH [Tenuibacillus multivorans]